MCTICKSDPYETDGLCPDCAADGLRPGEPIEKDWRRCQINGEWTGILHIPSWAVFEIDREEKTWALIRPGSLDLMSEEFAGLCGSALQLFLNGNVSRHPPSYISGEEVEFPERMPRQCRHPWGLGL